MDEPEIVEKAIAGDREAFRQLVERHQRFVFRVAYRFLGIVADAEDATQETFIRLWKHLSRYRNEVKLTTWLYKIVSNLCLDMLRSSHKRYSKLTRDISVFTDKAGSASADDSLLADELRAALARIADNLSPKQKVVYILRDMEEKSMEEIQNILGMSAAQVKSNLYYARKRIAEEIARLYEMRKTVEP